MTAPIGTCCICGTYGELSLEHLPPQTAFNKGKIVATDYDGAKAFHPLAEAKGQFKENGFALYTLCKKCNEQTGLWYVNEFAKWAREADRIFRETDGDPKISRLYHGYPSRFLKQVVAMLLSAGGPNLAPSMPEFRRFVTHPFALLEKPRARILAYYNPGLKIRLHELVGITNSNNGSRSAYTEFASYPFGFLFLEDGFPPDERLFDITWFGKYGYHESATVEMNLASLPVVDHLGAQFFSAQQAKQMRIPDDAVRWEQKKRTCAPPRIEKFTYGERKSI